MIGFMLSVLPDRIVSPTTPPPPRHRHTYYSHSPLTWSWSFPPCPRPQWKVPTRPHSNAFEKTFLLREQRHCGLCFVLRQDFRLALNSSLLPQSSDYWYYRQVLPSPTWSYPKTVILSSVVEHLPGMLKVLGSVPSPHGNKTKHSTIHINWKQMKSPASFLNKLICWQVLFHTLFKTDAI
jgi:hypothetical protein